MLLKLFLILLIIVSVILLLASFKPDDMICTRSLAIKAPPEKLYALVNDVKAWAAWSPYEKLDPAMKRSYGDIIVGKGAHYAWDGNSNVGAGSMTIVDTRPFEAITFDLNFLRPFKCTNQVVFTFVPKGNVVVTTWTMTGKANLISKTMSVFMDMDKMIGTQFQEGLENLQKLAEK